MKDATPTNLLLSAILIVLSVVGYLNYSSEPAQVHVVKQPAPKPFTLSLVWVPGASISADLDTAAARGCDVDVVRYARDDTDTWGYEAVVKCPVE